LQHPNIAGIYGIHEVDGRLQSGPLPVDEALALGKEIARARLAVLLLGGVAVAAAGTTLLTRDSPPEAPVMRFASTRVVNLLAPGERHDLVGRQPAAARSAQSRDDRIATGPPAMLLANPALSPTMSNSTSAWGRSPSWSRIAWGIVTCPLVVIRIPTPTGKNHTTAERIRAGSPETWRRELQPANGSCGRG
jgi:hypothetical protein